MVDLRFLTLGMIQIQEDLAERDMWFWPKPETRSIDSSVISRFFATYVITGEVSGTSRCLL